MLGATYGSTFEGAGCSNMYDHEEPERAAVVEYLWDSREYYLEQLVDYYEKWGLSHDEALELAHGEYYDFLYHIAKFNRPI